MNEDKVNKKDIERNNTELIVGFSSKKSDM
jgi:hypothetical protein